MKQWIVSFLLLACIGFGETDKAARDGAIQELDRLVELLEADGFKARKQAQQDLAAFMESADSFLWYHLANIDTIDPAGKPVEGVAVRPSYIRADGQSWLIGIPTDKQGEVELKVAPGLKRQFGVMDIRGPGKPVRGDNLKTEFELKGATDKVFEIQLNKAQMKLLPR